MAQPTKITIYHNKSCSKSCNALALLKLVGRQVETVDYLTEVPSIQDLKGIISKLKCTPHSLIRQSEPMYIEKFKGKNLSDEEWINVMHENPILIQRPIVITGNHAVVARTDENLQNLKDYLDEH